MNVHRTQARGAHFSTDKTTSSFFGNQVRSSSLSTDSAPEEHDYKRDTSLPREIISAQTPLDKDRKKLNHLSNNTPPVALFVHQEIVPFNLRYLLTYYSIIIFRVCLTSS